MRRASSPYEVRCPRCDVSFAPETRKCIHCGGRTTKAAPAQVRGRLEPGREFPTAEAPAPIEPEPSPIFSMQPAAGDLEEGEAEPGSLSRSLLRAFGTLLWIALLIVFTLARSCGGE